MYKKNILILSSDLLPGGISQMLAVHTLALINLDYKLTILLPKKSDAKSSIKSILKFSKNKKVNIDIVEYSKSQFYYSKILNTKFFRKYFNSVDLCFVHNARLIKFARRYTNKSIIAVNHTGKLSQIKYYKYADLVLSVNKKINTQLINAGIHTNKCIVCPNSLDNLPKLKKSNRNIENNLIVIGVIGRLVEKKGIEEFIESIKILKNRNIKLQALIAGDGELLNYLKDKSKEIPEIKFLGWVKNKSHFYSNLDVFCQPSYFEPFGLTVIEAMSYGLPVVSTSSDGPIEIINSPGNNGFIVPIKDPLQMANVIQELINDKNKRLEVGLNARRHIEKNYTIHNLQNLLLKCITKLS